jgi:hypothetical protein
MISTLKETCKVLEEKKLRLEAVIAGLELEEEQDQPEVNIEDDEEAGDHAAEDTEGSADILMTIIHVFSCIRCCTINGSSILITLSELDLLSILWLKRGSKYSSANVLWYNMCCQMCAHLLKTR